MLLSELIEPLKDGHLVGSGDPDITGVSYDSRAVTPGSLFACITGGRFDGHDFIADALARGAVALVTSKLGRASERASDAPIVEVPNVRDALPVLAARFYNYPSRRLKLVGVTGTKGKTTTTYLMDSVFREAGFASGIIGTLGVRVKDEVAATGNTTPESVDLQAALARMVSSGVSAAAMEVSSHALIKGRTDCCEFDVGVFTNLTRDHLDFHNTLEEYFAAKLALFSELPCKSGKPFTAVINIDDTRGEFVRDATRGRTLTYGIRNPADIMAGNISASANGVDFDVACPQGHFPVALKLGGIFNVYNSLSAIGAALALGLDFDAIRGGLEAVTLVPGRFMSVRCGQDFGVVIDYAHTPDSLENILNAARELTSGRLILVFGCGGDRDRGKRPIMGGLGAELADVCIVTSDNPRSEDPGEIINEIMTGMDGSKSVVERITERRDAIERALNIASSGDLVLIAGKGHETYQILKDRTVHFDDHEVVRELLAPSQPVLP